MVGIVIADDRSHHGNIGGAQSTGAKCSPPKPHDEIATRDDGDRVTRPAAADTEPAGGAVSTVPNSRSRTAPHRLPVGGLGGLRGLDVGGELGGELGGVDLAAVEPATRRIIGRVGYRAAERRIVGHGLVVTLAGHTITNGVDYRAASRSAARAADYRPGTTGPDRPGSTKPGPVVPRGADFRPDGVAATGGTTIAAVPVAGRPCAAQPASVTATSGEMSTLEARRDHNHASPSGRRAAPAIASSSAPCERWARPPAASRSTNVPHARA